MNIKARVKLDSHTNPFGDFAGTKAIVKFKDPRKIRLVKLKVYLCCYDYNKETREEFLKRCEESLALENVKLEVEYAIKEYFKNKKKNINNKDKLKNVYHTMKNFNKDKIEIEVEI